MQRQQHVARQAHVTYVLGGFSKLNLLPSSPAMYSARLCSASERAALPGLDVLTTLMPSRAGLLRSAGVVPCEIMPATVLCVNPRADSCLATSGNLRRGASVCGHRT